MNIEILKDLQEGLVVLLYIVGLCVLGVALHKLIIGKFCSGVPRKPRPEPKPILAGYQPIEPRIFYPINNLKEARLMLKQHHKDRESMPEDTMVCNYTAIWCDELQNINSIIIRFEAEEYVNNKYNLINQK